MLHYDQPTNKMTKCFPTREAFVYFLRQREIIKSNVVGYLNAFNPVISKPVISK